MAIPSIYYEIQSSNIDDICYMVDYESKTFKLKDFIINSRLFEFIQFLDKFDDDFSNFIIEKYKTELSNEKLLYLKLKYF